METLTHRLFRNILEQFVKQVHEVQNTIFRLIWVIGIWHHKQFDQHIIYSWHTNEPWYKAGRRHTDM